MKQKIRLTEGDLHRIVRKCVNEAMNEGELWNNVKDVARGATYGASHGFNKVADDNNNVHTLANGLSYACDAFGKIMKALSKQDIEEAEYLCKQAYTECKRDLNSTWGRGTSSTSDYGAQRRI